MIKRTVYMLLPLLLSLPCQLALAMESLPQQEAVEKLSLSKQTLIKGQYARAIRMLRMLSHRAPEPTRMQALELLGVAYARSDRPSLAQATWQNFLKQYPKGVHAVRVRQRILHLRENQLIAKAPIASANRDKSRPDRTRLSHTIQQYYQRSTSLLDNDLSASTDYNSLYTRVNSRWRKHQNGRDFLTNLHARYRADFVGSDASPVDISKAMFSFRDSRSGISTRVGRQTGRNLGLIGKFDGMVAGLRLPIRSRLNVFSGYPVRFNTRDTINSEELFYGAGINITPNKQIELSPYFVEQKIQRFTARRGVGFNLNYFVRNTIARINYDHDIRINRVNLFALNVEQKQQRNLWLLMLDLRRNPLLDARTVLQATTDVIDMEELHQRYSDDEINSLLDNLTGNARTLMLGWQRTLNRHIQLSTDVTASSYVYKQQETEQNIVSFEDGSMAYSGRMVASDYTRYREANIVGLTLLNGNGYASRLYFASSRWPVKGGWNATAKLRQYVRESETGVIQKRLFPGLSLFYRPNRSLQIDVEVSREWYSFEGNTLNPGFTRSNINLGYRYFF